MAIEFPKLNVASNYRTPLTTPDIPVTSRKITETGPAFLEDTSSYSAPITTSDIPVTPRKITETGPVFLEDTSSYSAPITTPDVSKSIVKKSGAIDIDKIPSTPSSTYTRGAIETPALGDEPYSSYTRGETETDEVTGQSYSLYRGGAIETPALGDEFDSTYTTTETGDIYGNGVLSTVGSVTSASSALPSVSTTSGTLGMASTSYGRSSVGMNKLKANFQSDIQNTIDYLHGPEYSNMINTVSKYWTGPDADKFIIEVQKMLSQDADLFKSYVKTVQDALNSDLSYFDKSQSNVANTIKRV